LGPSQLNENLFFIEEPVIIRTLPQYADYHGLYYNNLLKDINSGKSIPDNIIKTGSEFRILCK